MPEGGGAVGGFGAVVGMVGIWAKEEDEEVRLRVRELREELERCWRAVVGCRGVGAKWVVSIAEVLVVGSRRWKGFVEVVEVVEDREAAEKECARRVDSSRVRRLT